MEQYLRTRWALDERFTVTKTELAPGEPFAANPTVAFTRVFSQGAHRGNAKLVCSGGNLQEVVMSSEPAPE